MPSAVRRLAVQASLMAEAGGAAAVAAFLFHAGEVPAARVWLAVLSGGNIDPQLLARILAEDWLAGGLLADMPGTGGRMLFGR
jgi:threonine dehydratase